MSWPPSDGRRPCYGRRPVPYVLGLNLYTEQYISGLLALALPLVFLHVPASGKRGGRKGPVPWYDLAAAIVGFLVASICSFSSPICRNRWLNIL